MKLENYMSMTLSKGTEEFFSLYQKLHNIIDEAKPGTDQELLDILSSVGKLGDKLSPHLFAMDCATRKKFIEAKMFIVGLAKHILAHTESKTI